MSESCVDSWQGIVSAGTLRARFGKVLPRAKPSLQPGGPRQGGLKPVLSAWAAIVHSDRMLCGPSCPRLPSAAVLALRHRLSSPLALDLHHRAEFGTRLSVSDWREPLIRCGAAAAPSAVLETSPAEAPPTSGSPASPTFSSLGLDKRVTVRALSIRLFQQACRASCGNEGCVVAGRLG